MFTKGGTMIRIAALNVGCLQAESKHWKNDDLWQWVKQQKIDVALLSEIGVNWSKIGRMNSWKSRTKKHVYTERHSLSYNEREQLGSLRQWGGTACTMTGNITGRYKSRANDPRKLGRWASMAIRGKRDTTIRFVSVYIPNKGGQSAGTVHNQQASWLESQGIHTPPISQLIQDLEESIRQWKEAEETVIVGGDINMPVNRSQMANMMARLHMKEAILSRHPTGPGVSTNVRASTDRVIDGIWVPASLQIVRSGYSEFGPWDHRTAWIEVAQDSVFGTTSRPTSKFEGRRVRLNRPITVKRYQTEVRKQYRRVNMQRRVESLREEIESSKALTPGQVERMESIDSDRTHIMLAAEKKARTIHMGKVPFSPEVKKRAMEKQFWNLAWKRRGGTKVSSRWYERAKKQAGISTRTATLSKEDLDKKRKRAHEKWKKAKKDAQKHRATFLQQRADEEAKAGNISAESALVSIQKREEVVETFRAIRQVMGDYDSNSKVTMVIANNESGEEEVYDKEQTVITQCMKANEAKYRQAYVTPLQHPTFARDIRNMSIQSAQRRHHRKLGQHDNHLLDELGKTGAIPWKAEDLHITTSSHQQLWSKAREKTTSGPSGLHFGLWKANAKCDDLANIDAIMREVSLRTGYNLKRWLKCTDVTLLKEPGNFRVSRFRTISLVEGDFNANLKWIGKIMMKHAETHQMLPEEQYGSRKQRSAAEVSLNNRMTDDIIRITAATSCICSNDAKSCYDRMAHVPLELSMRRLGVPEVVGESVTSAVQSMQHHVLTGFGRSTRTYPHRGSKLQGLLQGLGISPAGWVAMSSPIMAAMTARGFGFKAVSPTKQVSTKLVCFSFVDDTDLIHSVQSDVNDPEECVREIQQVVDAWEGMLRATGGALEPRKSYWYLMSFKWEGAGWKYKTIEEQPGDINIRQPDSQDRSTLLRLRVDQARKALGVMVRHDGVQKDNEEYYASKAEQWADKMRRGRMLRTHAWIAMKSTIWKALEYPLTSATFTREATERIMRPVLMAALPAAGVQRNVSRQLVFGPSEGLGLGVEHLYYVQITRHLESVARHWQRSTLTGKLMHTLVELLTIQVGVPDVFQQDPSQWGHLAEDSWMKSLWMETSGVGITVQWESRILHAPRQNDAPIMVRVKALALGPQQEKIINLCRIAKKVFWLSDIVSVGGDHLLPSADQPGDVPLRATCLNWPPVGKLSSASWKAWQQVIRRIFPASRTGSVQLEQHLGQWRGFTSQQPLVFWDPASDRLHDKSQPSKVFARIPRRSRRRLYAEIEGEECNPAKLVDGYRHSGKIVVTGASEGMTAEPRSPTSVEMAIQAMQRTQSWSVQQYEIAGSWDTVAQSIRQGTAVACSDGSVADGSGASGAVILAEYGGETAQLIIANLAPATNGVMQSHRAELSGLYGVLTMLAVICEVHGVDGGSAEIGCDNVGALKALDKEWRLSPSSTDADLLRAVRNSCEDLPITIRGRHVKGHQDNKTEWHRLDRWARLNVIADKVAGAARSSMLGTTAYDGHIRGERVSFMATAKLTQVNYSAVAGERTQQEAVNVLISRRAIDDASHVAWPTIGRVLKQIGQPKRVLITKLITGEAPLGKRMKRWGMRLSDQCPGCAASEDAKHFWQCPSGGRREVAHRLLSDIRRWLQRYPTHPAVAASISVILRSQFDNSAYLQIASPGSMLHEAIQHQLAVGHQSLRKGLIVTHWESMQEEYLRQQQSRRSAAKWARQLVRRIWHIAWEQWTVRNDELFHSQDSAEAEMIQALENRAASLRLRLEEDQAANRRILLSQPAEGATTAQVAVWVEQAAMILREPAASGALLTWLRYRRQAHPDPGYGPGGSTEGG